MSSSRLYQPIDIHNHVLPELDDGSDGIAESVRMLEWYASRGIRTIVATPHMVTNLDPEWLIRYKRALQAISEQAAPLDVRVVAGAEVRLDPDFEENDAYTIEGTNYVLVDFPSGFWPHYAENMLFRLQVMGYRPILAHPERYGWQVDRLIRAESLANRGIVLQVTLASFTGYFGADVRKTAIDLLEAGHVHLVATDAHNSEGRLESAEHGLTILRRSYGDEVADILFEENPSKIIEARDVEPVQIQKSAFSRIASRFSFGSRGGAS